MSGAETENAASHDPKPGRLHLNADNKQEEDDTKLGQVPYLIYRCDIAQPPGPDQCAAYQKAQDGTETEALEQWHSNHGCCQQYQDIDNEVSLGQGSILRSQISDSPSSAGLVVKDVLTNLGDHEITRNLSKTSFAVHCCLWDYFGQCESDKDTEGYIAS